MTRYEYDEEASQRHHMDVVYEIDDSRIPVVRWVDRMRRLNAINDPLARKLIALHRACGSGSGVCDGVGLGEAPGRAGWGCETTELIASHYSISSS